MNRTIQTIATTVEISVTVTDSATFETSFNEVAKNMPSGYTREQFMSGLAHRAAVRGEDISGNGAGSYIRGYESDILAARFGEIEFDT